MARHLRLLKEPRSSVDPEPAKLFQGRLGGRATAEGAAVLAYGSAVFRLGSKAPLGQALDRLMATLRMVKGIGTAGVEAGGQLRIPLFCPAWHHHFAAVRNEASQS